MADKNTFTREHHHEDMHLQAEKVRKKEEKRMKTRKKRDFPLPLFIARDDVSKMKHVYFHGKI